MDKLRVEVLAAAMNADSGLIDKMNIKSDAVIGNQCDRTGVEVYSVSDCTVRVYSFAERGVGLNRNNALLRASGDIVLFADDDMTYVDDYTSIVQEAYTRLPQADCIIFNLITKGGDVDRRSNDRIKRVRFWNSLNYGAARISARLNSIQREGIFFNTCFGGGTPFSAGEDTLFIQSMLRAGLKIYTYPAVIAEVDQSTSSWFNGYTEKYFYDKGVLLRAVSAKSARLLALRDAIKRREKYCANGLTLGEVYALMVKGIKAYKSMRPYPNDNPSHPNSAPNHPNDSATSHPNDSITNHHDQQQDK